MSEVAAKYEALLASYHWASVKGGATSGIRLYDRIISGEVGIGKTTRLIAIAEGRDPMQEFIEKRSELVTRLAEAMEALDEIKSAWPDLHKWARQEPPPWSWYARLADIHTLVRQVTLDGPLHIEARSGKKVLEFLEHHGVTGAMSKAGVVAVCRTQAEEAIQLLRRHGEVIPGAKRNKYAGKTWPYE